MDESKENPAPPSTLLDRKVFKAAENGEVQELENLLKLKANPNSSQGGKPVLFAATRYNQVACLKLLLSFGADATVSVGGRTALTEAVEERREECEKAIVNHLKKIQAGSKTSKAEKQAAKDTLSGGAAAKAKQKAGDKRVTLERERDRRQAEEEATQAQETADAELAAAAAEKLNPANTGEGKLLQARSEKKAKEQLEKAEKYAKVDALRRAIEVKEQKAADAAAAKAKAVAEEEARVAKEEAKKQWAMDVKETARKVKEENAVRARAAAEKAAEEALKNKALTQALAKARHEWDEKRAKRALDKRAGLVAEGSVEWKIQAEPSSAAIGLLKREQWAPRYVFFDSRTRRLEVHDPFLPLSPAAAAAGAAGSGGSGGGLKKIALSPLKAIPAFRVKGLISLAKQAGRGKNASEASAAARLSSGAAGVLASGSGTGEDVTAGSEAAEATAGVTTTTPDEGTEATAFTFETYGKILSGTAVYKQHGLLGRRHRVDVSATGPEDLDSECDLIENAAHDLITRMLPHTFNDNDGTGGLHLVDDVGGGGDRGGGGGGGGGGAKAAVTAEAAALKVLKAKVESEEAAEEAKEAALVAEEDEEAEDDYLEIEALSVLKQEKKGSSKGTNRVSAVDWKRVQELKNRVKGRIEGRKQREKKMQRRSEARWRDIETAEKKASAAEPSSSSSSSSSSSPASKINRGAAATEKGVGAVVSAPAAAFADDDALVEAAARGWAGRERSLGRQLQRIGSPPLQAVEGFSSPVLGITEAVKRGAVVSMVFQTQEQAKAMVQAMNALQMAREERARREKERKAKEEEEVFWAEKEKEERIRMRLEELYTKKAWVVAEKQQRLRAKATSDANARKLKEQQQEITWAREKAEKSRQEELGQAKEAAKRLKQLRAAEEALEKEWEAEAAAAAAAAAAASKALTEEKKASAGSSKQQQGEEEEEGGGGQGQGNKSARRSVTWAPTNQDEETKEKKEEGTGNVKRGSDDEPSNKNKNKTKGGKTDGGGLAAGTPTEEAEPSPRSGSFQSGGVWHSAATKNHNASAKESCCVCM